MCSAVAVYQDGELSTTSACRYCGVPFIPHDRRQITCGASLCRSRNREARKRERFARLPELAERYREQRALRRARGRDRWMVGAPQVSGHLPGRGFLLELSSGRVIQHRHIRGLHGIMSALVDRESAPVSPWWTLLPARSGCGWAAYVREPQATRLLEQSAVHEVRLYDSALQLRLTNPWQARYPQVSSRGHRQLRIDTITPVVFRSYGGTTPRTTPSRSGLLSCLCHSLPDRIGVTVDPADIMIDVLSHDTRTERLWVGGRPHPIIGWVGSVVVDTNAVGELLLRCAAAGPGLGGRVAYGFGRVVVSESIG